MDAKSPDSKGGIVTCEALAAKKDDNASPAKPEQTESTISTAKIANRPDNSRRSTETPATTKFEIYWRSPITMISTFVLGLGLCFALHGFYSSLDGEQVGEIERQQMALRYHSDFLNELTSSNMS